MKAKDVLAVRVPKSLKRDLAVLAKNERRTLSNLVEVLLIGALAQRTPSQEKVA